VEWVRRGLPPTWPLLLRLFLEVATGALVYLGILWLFHRERLVAIIERARSVLTKKSALAIKPGV
jgi:hypothetical protein